MTIKKERVERRRYRRFKGQSGAMLVHTGHSTELGHIGDMTMGGLACSYVAKEKRFIESYEEVLAAHNLTDIAIIKSLLDAQGITYFFDGDGEHPAHVKRLADPARLMVKKDEAALARDLLERVEIVTDGCSS